MIVSGHNRFLRALDFSGVRAPQPVVGTGGGTSTQRSRETPWVGKEVNGARVIEATSRYGYAYILWDKTTVGWEGTLFDQNGVLVQRCHLVARRLSCE